ncbi:unnamed protein product [Protopolystoma xenopodis]|uniref:Uncharacterized protein n=1 Tax=Protopolystoma xenopodis TaxID=117903 RepID=A0A3S5FGB0_9PLAT|nr:unnamed protein product [Protopolystoma xenopodis]
MLSAATRREVILYNWPGRSVGRRACLALSSPRPVVNWHENRSTLPLCRRDSNSPSALSSSPPHSSPGVSLSPFRSQFSLSLSLSISLSLAVGLCLFVASLASLEVTSAAAVKAGRPGKWLWESWRKSRRGEQMRLETATDEVRGTEEGSKLVTRPIDRTRGGGSLWSARVEKIKLT